MSIKNNKKVIVLNNKSGFARTPILALLPSFFKRLNLVTLSFHKGRFFQHSLLRQQKTTPKLVSGFAMLFAVLASSLLMAIGISMFNISIKEIQIATSERDSQIAYYAADSARECAIYSDIIGPLFTCDPSDPSSCPLSVPATITCNGTSTTLLFSRSSGNYIYNLAPNSPTIFFRYSTTSIAEPEGGASIIQKIFSAEGGIFNTISAFGHNTGIIGRRVERSVSNQY